MVIICTRTSEPSVMEVQYPQDSWPSSWKYFSHLWAITSCYHWRQGWPFYPQKTWEVTYFCLVSICFFFCVFMLSWFFLVTSSDIPMCISLFWQAMFSTTVLFMLLSSWSSAAALSFIRSLRSHSIDSIIIKDLCNWKWQRKHCFCLFVFVSFCCCCWMMFAFFE